MSPVQYRTHFRRSKQLLSHIRDVLHFRILLGCTAVRWRASNGLFVLSSSFNAPLPLPFTAYGISKPRVIAREHGITMRIGGLQQNLPGIALAVGAVVAEAVPALYPGRRNETIVRAVIGPRIIERTAHMLDILRTFGDGFTQIDKAFQQEGSKPAVIAVRILALHDLCIGKFSVGVFRDLYVPVPIDPATASFPAATA